MSQPTDLIQSAQRTIRLEIEAIQDLLQRINGDFVRACQLILDSKGRVVVVGMGLNPFPAKARKLLERNGTPYHYLSYGNYFSFWRQRLALKLWSGWSTFPLVFVNGTLIGGATDLQKLIEKHHLVTIEEK